MSTNARDPGVNVWMTEQLTALIPTTDLSEQGTTVVVKRFVHEFGFDNKSWSTSLTRAA